MSRIRLITRAEVAVGAKTVAVGVKLVAVGAKTVAVSEDWHAYHLAHDPGVKQVGVKQVGATAHDVIPDLTRSRELPSRNR